MFIPTPDQQKALDSSRHLSITANAGSGKTRVLVERYLTIVLTGKARVPEVVAITFTEKAASELKRKIAEEIGARLAAAEHAATRITLEVVRDELSGAVIDTIHSFCARLLRDYPVEANVDAAFTVLEEIDRIALIEVAVKDTFADILGREERDAQRQQMFDVLRTYGKKRLLDVVHAMIRRRELVERWLSADGVYARSDDELLDYWRSTITQIAQRVLDDQALVRDLADLVHAAESDDAPSLLDAVNQSPDLSSKVTALDALVCRLLTEKGVLRKRLFPEPQPALVEAARRVFSQRNMLLSLAPSLAGDDETLHRQYVKHIRFLIDLYREVVRRYNEAKGEGTYLDFDDLQLKTRDLLANERIRQKVVQRFKFIMVDEYQDTNLLQYEILLPLLSNLRHGNLCIVGDPKQSIYGFRDADVSVFNRTKRDIVSASGEGSIVTLGASFRLLRDVAAFINVVFSSVMNNDDDEFEVAYESLVCARQNEAPGRVEILLVPPPEAITPDDDDADSENNGLKSVVEEEELIARRILQLVQTSYRIYDRKEQAQALRFRDIAILLRSRTGLGTLEEALIRHHVPYLVSGGVGYFQTQAIYDFYHYFSFLLDTYDDVALVGILRSPFFNVSDAELLEWRLKHASGELWETMKNAREDNAQFPAMQRAAQQLRRDLALRFRLTVPELIDHIIEETAYAGFIAGTTRAEQMRANLEKLKRVALQYAGRGFTNLYDFTKRLRRLIEEYHEEGQATVDVDADAVRIITVHSVKGLEFPVVFVPSLDRRFRYDTSCYLDDKLGLGIFPSDASDAAVPIVKLLKQKSDRRVKAEEKRIFYVACTRARDMLVLSSSTWKGMSSPCWGTWLLDALSLDPQTVAPMKTFEITTECLRLNDRVYEQSPISHQLPVHLVRPDDVCISDSPPVLRDKDESPSVEVHIERIPALDAGEVFSATKIRTYMECPSKYYLRYVVGLPASTVRLFNEEIGDEEDVEIPKDLRGRAFHYVMQNIDEIAEDRGAIVEELRNFIARDSYAILSEPSIELEALADTILGVVHSAFWNDVQEGSESRTEFTIMTKIDDDILLGTLDRVYRDREGIWTVVDFKTDEVTPDTLRDKQQQYEAQVKFYSLLVRKHFGGDAVRACLLFAQLAEHPVWLTFASSQLTSFEEEIRAVIARIRAGEFARRGGPCNGCPFLPKGCSF